MTAPFQLDGRIAALEEQAQGAITSHGEGGTVSSATLEGIAAFQRTVFSSDRARRVAEYLAGGGAPAKAPDVEDELVLTPTEERGRVVYDAVCAACHGGASTATIAKPEIQALAFPALRSYRYRFYTDGTRAEIAADLPPVPASDDPFASVLDSDGNPVIGPNFA